MITPRIKHFKELNSTNSYALEHFDELKLGDIVSADIQTHGRGRFNRVWAGNSPDNIYMSFVIVPESIDNFPFINLTQYLSVVINKVFREKYNIQTDIKWPNDILFEGKKLVGILAEAKIKQGKFAGIVLGVGINVNHAPVDIVPNAECLSSILNNKEIDKVDLRNAVCNEFFASFDDFSEKGFKLIEEDYKKLCKFNDELKIGNSYKEGEFTLCRFVRLNDDGTLTVLSKNKEGIEEEVKIVSGDILC